MIKTNSHLIQAAVKKNILETYSLIEAKIQHITRCQDLIAKSAKFVATMLLTICTMEINYVRVASNFIAAQ